MTEEQAVKIWTTCISPYEKTELAFFIKNMKDEGYIKQNPVEKAKEMYEKYVQDSDQNEFLHVNGIELVKELRLAIEYLERKHENKIEQRKIDY